MRSGVQRKGDVIWVMRLKRENTSFNLDPEPNTKHMHDNNNHIQKKSNRNTKSLPLRAFQRNSLFHKFHKYLLGGSRNRRHPRGTPRLSILPTITNERLDTTILINPQERCNIGRNRRVSIVLKVAVARSENATDDFLSRDFVGPHGDRVLGPVFW